MEQKEIQDIVISAVALAVAFSIASIGGISAIPALTLELIGISFVAVSLGFILHELSHRLVANVYGAYAEYRMWNTGVAVALLSSLFGFIFAAPGAVYIHPKSDMWGRAKGISTRENGIISIAGPLANVAIALLFFIGGKLFPLGTIANYGIFINLWLAFFNMIPIPPLDGSKVLRWDARLWLVAIALMGLMMTL